MQNVVNEQQQQQQQQDAAMRSQTDPQGTPQAAPPAAQTPAGSTQQLPAPHPGLLLSTPRANLLTATQQALPSPSGADSPLKEMRRVWEQQAQQQGTPPAVTDTPRPAQQMQATHVSTPSRSR